MMMIMMMITIFSAIKAHFDIKPKASMKLLNLYVFLIASLSATNCQPFNDDINDDFSGSINFIAAALLKIVLLILRLV